MWPGYFEEFPDYMTHGESLEQLEESSGEIAGIRRVAQLTLGSGVPT